MNNDNIFDELDKNSYQLKTESIEKYIEPIHESLKKYINYLAFVIYKDHVDSFKKEAFNAQTKDKIFQVLNDFYFKFELWKKNRKFKPYIKKSLLNLAKNIKKIEFGLDTEQRYICPLCKEEGLTSYLYKDNNLLCCSKCINDLDDIKNSSIENILHLNLKTLYARHSKKGYYCLECSRFLPHSIINGDIISCPFNDCLFSSSIFNLKLTYYHPNTSWLKKSKEIEINEEIYPDLKDSSLKKVIINEELEKVSLEIENILNIEKKKIKRTNLNSSIQKISFIESFELLLNEFPEEIIPYLVSDERSSLPLQSLIFQKYVQILENKLPFHLGKNEIFDLMDDNLGLFLGISKFQTQIIENKILNKTKEHYISKTNKDNGPCYIGKLIDIFDDEKSYLSCVNYYSFSEIILNTKSFHGKTVTVMHYRIPAHYQMGNLVFLQQIRKNLGNKIKNKIHGKK